ncbi:hypothetical protein LJD49_29690, partial [Escherichia coli]|uniref:hypothetical protein n=1 Tax=Escherichia coli TaxID=562 RepID=UPI001D09A8BE
IADQQTGRLAEAVAAQTDPAERLVRAVGSYTGYLLEHRAGVEVMFQPGLDSAQYRATHERTRKFWDLFIDLAMRATPNGGYAEVFV